MRKAKIIQKEAKTKHPKKAKNLEGRPRNCGGSQNPEGSQKQAPRMAKNPNGRQETAEGTETKGKPNNPRKSTGPRRTTRKSQKIEGQDSTNQKLLNYK